MCSELTPPSLDSRNHPTKTVRPSKTVALIIQF